MENLETQSQETQVLQPEIEQRYDPSLAFSTNEPIAETVAETTTEAAEEGAAATTEEALATTESPEVIEWKQKYEELANKAPEVQYAVPDELIEKATNPETFQDIVRIKGMSPADANKERIKLENPWATTDEDLDNLLRQEFPDFDPDIPENYGMDATTFKRFSFLAEGQKSQMLVDATGKLKEDLKSFVPAPKENAPFDEKAFEATVKSHIDNSIAAYKAPEIPAIEGFELNATVDMNKVRELAEGSAKGPFYVNEDGMILPDVNAIADRLLLDQLRQQLKPMADALLRKAPEVTKDAIIRSLNNTQPPVNASGPDPNTYKQKQPERYEGIKVASVSN